MPHHLQDLPFHLVRRLMQAHTALWKQQVRELTKPQFALLCAIEERPGVEQASLMQPAVATKATLAELIKRMEARGLVQRTRDTNDRRRVYVHLTQAGQQLIAQVRPLSEQVDQTFLSRLSEEEQAQFGEFLQRLVASQ